MRKTAPDKITTLAPNQVFVFGCNTAGGHGGGAAGIAFKGSARCDYNIPTDKVGRWAVYGVAGYSEGKEGKSFGIVTKRAWSDGKRLHIGGKRSVGIMQVYESFLTLLEHAKAHPELEYLCTKFGTQMAGFGDDIITRMIRDAHREHGIPDNILLPADWEFRDVKESALAVLERYEREHKEVKKELEPDWCDILGDAIEQNPGIIGQVPCGGHGQSHEEAE